MSNLAAVRQLLEQRYPDAAPLTQRAERSVATGIPALDRILPGGGLPRGTLTAWHSQGGAAAILRAACRTISAAGARAVWIDAAGTFAQDSAAESDLLLLRPAGALHGLRSAEGVLRSGGVTLAVLAGVEPADAAAVRLTRAAREGGSACVVLARGVGVARLRLQSCLHPQSYRWDGGPFGEAIPREAAVEVWVRTLGWQARATIVLPVTPYELRLSLDPALADRRGNE